MSRARRLAFLLLAVLVPLVAYLTAVNLFLNTRLGEATINRNPDRWYLEWSRAWSLSPGRVSLRSVTIRGQSPSLDWLAELDRVDVSLRLVPLFNRHFHATSIRGSGLEFRLSRDGPDTSDAGLSPAVQDPAAGPPAGAKPQRRAGRREQGWRLELDAIHVDDLRVLSIDEYRLDGGGELAGNLDLRIRGPLAVDDGRLELRDATLRVGEETAARALQATITADLAPVTPLSLDALDVLDHLSGELELDAGEASIRAVNRYLKKVPWLTLAGSGHLRSKARFDEGRIEPGSRLDFESPLLSAFFLDYEARGNGRLEASVSAAQLPETRIEVRLDDFEVRREGYDKPHVRGAGFEVDVTALGLDLRGDAEAASVEVRLPRSEVPDLSFYSAYVPAGSGMAIVAGRGTIDGSLRASTTAEDGEGGLHLEGTGVTIQMQNLTLAGDLELTTRLSGFGIAARRLALDGSHLEIRDVELSDGGKVEARRWHATFELPRGVLSFDPRELTATLTARLEDSRPVVALVAEKAWLLEWFEGLLTVENVDLETDIRVDERALAFDRLVVQGDQLEILARLRFEEQQRRGIVYTRWRGFSVGLELGPDGRDWKLRRPRRWFVSRAGFDAPDREVSAENRNP